MKLLFTILIVYLAYKIMFNTKKIESPPKKESLRKKDREEGEYIDFEEMD